MDTPTATKKSRFPQPTMPTMSHHNSTVDVSIDEDSTNTIPARASSSSKPLGEKIALLFTFIMLGGTIGFCSITAMSQFNSQDSNSKQVEVSQPVIETHAKK